MAIIRLRTDRAASATAAACAPCRWRTSNAAPNISKRTARAPAATRSTRLQSNRRNRASIRAAPAAHFVSDTANAGGAACTALVKSAVLKTVTETVTPRRRKNARNFSTARTTRTRAEFSLPPRVWPISPKLFFSKKRSRTACRSLVARPARNSTAAGTRDSSFAPKVGPLR